MNDPDFQNFVQDYDFLLLTETWHSNVTNLSIDGYESFSCIRPKANKRAKRDSGGVIVYYRERYRKHLDLLSVNNNGILWFKLQKDFGDFENDIYLCVCYIPPEGSAVYRNQNSNLFEFDFFNALNDDIRKYNDLGTVYITGDLNSRTGTESDFVPDINLDRFVEVPENTDICSLPSRKNNDSYVNSFGLKLLNLCKESSISIVNGRLEEGKCKFHGFYRNRPVASTVDYIITSDAFKNISDCCVLDLTEHSDHCPVTFALKGANRTSSGKKDGNRSYEKISWDSSKRDSVIQTLTNKQGVLDELTNNLLSGNIDVNECVESFSKFVYDNSFEHCGKKYFSKKTRKVYKAEWFDENCRKAKCEFLNAKRMLLANNSSENKTAFLNCRSHFANTKRLAKSKFYNKEKTKSSNVSKNSPRKFWKYIKKFRKCNKTEIDADLNDFVGYFSDLSNTPHEQERTGNDQNLDSDSTENIEMLDQPFSIDEIKKTISTLKRNKSCDLDNNVADFFIDTKDFIYHFLCLIFDKIYDTGIYPDSWTKGIIVPIFKKGDPSEPSNYRGITLINIMGKIFSLTLRNRLNAWCEQENIFHDTQFGFRDNCATVDAVFLLHTVIQKVLSNNSKLWCAFIDYQRAFDTVIRESLWIRLVQSGISCKMLRMIRSLYETVKSCVRISSDMDFSSFFDVTLGLKQGEPLSPILFILCINDIVNHVYLDDMTDRDLELLSRYLIAFADDIVLFTTSPNSLQLQMDKIYRYSLKWDLKINVSKTKIFVFEKKKTGTHRRGFDRR